jgi:hypothetical protein
MMWEARRDCPRYPIEMLAALAFTKVVTLGRIDDVCFFVVVSFELI